MEYTVLRVNDNNTATVEMTIGDSVLVQDFDLGESQGDLTTNIGQGLVVFQNEITRNTAPLAYAPIVGTPITVSSKDFQSFLGTQENLTE